MVKTKIIVFLLILNLYKTSGQEDNCAKERSRNAEFKNYLLKYRIYVPNTETMEKYQQQYFRTVQEVEDFNAQPGNLYRQTINKFAHLSYNEIMQTSFGLSLLRYNLGTNPSEKSFKPKCTPKPIDWSKIKGAVSPVKDQGNCGNSFVFSTVGALESFTFIRTNKSYVLSEQFAMDCCDKLWKIDNNGCNGGQPEFIYDIIIQKHGLPKEKSYPYLAHDSTLCPHIPVVAESIIESFKTLETNDEDDIACMLADGPLTVAIFVNSSLLRYGNGIYNDVTSCNSVQLVNHAVLLVGYDKDEKTGAEYFIFKNSWGVGYGEDGYFRMQKGVNLCGITNLVQQPSLESYDY